MTAPSGAFDRALDQLGAAIVGGELEAGAADTIEGFIARTGASRSVVREVTRVLGGLGMLSAGRRVGLRIRPAEEWDLLDPRVIRWRLEGPGRDPQLRTLTELRHLRRNHVRAEVAGAVDPGLPGVHDLAVADGVLTCSVDPEGLDGLLAALAGVGNRALTVQPPSLEELFLEAYRTGDGAREAS